MRTRKLHSQIKQIIAALVLVYLTVSTVFAQPERPYGMIESDLPHFNLDILNFPTDSINLSRLDFYIQVPYEMLSFVKTNDEFNASYEVTIDIFDKKDSLISEKLFTENIVTPDYKKSISQTTGKISQRSMILAPETYTIVVQIRDSETKKLSQVKRLLTMRDFSQSQVSLGDIMVVSQMQKDGNKTAIVPNIAGTVQGGGEDVHFYAEAITKTYPADATVILTVQGKLGITVASDTLPITFSKPRQSCFLTVPGKALQSGQYTVEMKSYIADSVDAQKLQLTSTVTRKLFVKLPGLPFMINDLDVAIDELMYVASKDEMDSLRSVAGEQKREAFLSFWKKRDPTKETDVNELMQEYYQRIDFANKNFSHYVDGWKTDRGNVYVVFGEPSNIERHPLDIDAKPYEVWTYYDQNRTFVFIDETGFGDYRLRDPIWEQWRGRNR